MPDRIFRAGRVMAWRRPRGVGAGGPGAERERGTQGVHALGSVRPHGDVRARVKVIP